MKIVFTACYHLFFAIMLGFNILLLREDELITPVLYWDQVISCITQQSNIVREWS